MRRLKHYILCLILCVFCAAADASAQARLRGVTVGHNITPEDIQVLGTWRANSVRYPLSWHGTANNATLEDYDAWLTGALDYLDTLLPYFEAARIRVVLNLYTPPGGFASSGGTSHRVFLEAPVQQAFIAAWERIATRYAGDTRIYAFDLLNEPAQRTVTAGLMDWNALALATGQAIRAIDPARTLVVEPRFGDQFRMSALRPIGLTNVIYSFHTYYPFSFSYQALPGYRAGVKYPTKTLTKATLERALQQVIVFQRRYRVPIYVGEFSAIRWAPGESAYYYLRDLTAIFEKYRWSWTYHAFRESHAWSVEHGSNRRDLRPTTRQTSRAKLLRAYFRRNG